MPPLSRPMLVMQADHYSETGWHVASIAIHGDATAEAEGFQPVVVLGPGLENTALGSLFITICGILRAYLLIA